MTQSLPGCNRSRLLCGMCNHLGDRLDTDDDILFDADMVDGMENDDSDFDMEYYLQ